jgi:hypothetical protein
VIKKRLTRFTTATTAAVLLVAMAFAAGPAAGATPSWSITADRLPTAVAAGKDAGYFVTIKNNGPSQINALSVLATPASTPDATPSYFSGLDWNQGGPGTCSSTGQLSCDLGTLTAGTTITFTVAYAVPSSQNGTFNVAFAIRAGTGDTGSDGKGKSRGDKLEIVAKTGIGSSQNFDAGFVVGSGTFETTGNLGQNNKQTTKLETADSLIPVTITDGISSYPCTDCTNLIGEWSVLNVNDGVNDAPIKVTLFVWGRTVPGGVQADDIYLLHADGDGGSTAITAACDASPPTNADCIESVTKVGPNYRIVAWLEHNGAIRGGW